MCFLVLLGFGVFGFFGFVGFGIFGFSRVCGFSLILVYTLGNTLFCTLSLLAVQLGDLIKGEKGEVTGGAGGGGGGGSRT